ncbi:sigma-70 family RNA polymerase sigma factor [candidate division KSB1 bacterium]|nr:sigma-70 family RNA polymerase sigma factor [candidate division KSB1 bacterium]
MNSLKNNSPQSGDVGRLVDHLFRHQAAQIISTLTRIFGPENLDLAEDVVQETLLKALRQWPFSGVPNNPSGWILQTAKNLAIDTLRREASFRDKAEAIAYQLEQDMAASEDESQDHGLKSDQLAMMFTCCHPRLSREVQVALTLKTLCGLSVPEIAKAFLTPETTIAQRLVRAKRKIRDEKIPFEMPATRELAARLDAVLEVLYLLFNEGYNAHEGENLVRQDLCTEAIRLTSLLVEHPIGGQPKVHAMLALMLLQASRLPARVDAEENLLLLAEQDRTKWDRNLIQLGFYHLDKAAHGDELTEYHLQAGIAACHAVAPSYAATNWQQILSYYDELIYLTRSPIVALNRAVALSMLNGVEAGIKELESLSNLPAMQSYYLLPATHADFYLQKGEPRKAAEYYHQALALASTEPERRFLLRKLKACGKDEAQRDDIQNESLKLPTDR